MRWPEPRKSRIALALGCAAVFALSALTRVDLLLALWPLAAALFWRSARSAGRKVLRLVLPLVSTLALTSWAWLWLIDGQAPQTAPFFALVLRTSLIAFCTFALLERVDLLAACARWPTLLRLLTMILGQIHALRLLTTESLHGWRSRMPDKPRALQTARNAGVITGTMLRLSTHNAREIAEAMRSRGS